MAAAEAHAVGGWLSLEMFLLVTLNCIIVP
jgi:hypothetical protein